MLTRLEYLLVSVQFAYNLHGGVAEISEINVNGSEDETCVRNLSLECFCEIFAFFNEICKVKKPLVGKYETGTGDLYDFFTHKCISLFLMNNHD